MTYKIESQFSEHRSLARELDDLRAALDLQ
jgi:hypothetical protein